MSERTRSMAPASGFQFFRLLRVISALSKPKPALRVQGLGGRGLILCLFLSEE